MNTKMEKLYEFFKENHDRVIIHERYYRDSIVSYHYLIMIKSGIEGVNLIYQTESSSKNNLEVNNEMYFAGIFHKSSFTFYEYLRNRYMYDLDEDYKELKIRETDLLVTNFEAEVKERIKSLVKDNIGDFSKNILSLDSINHIKFVAKRDAEELFFQDSEINQDIYLEYIDVPDLAYSEDIYIKYLGNPSVIISDYANDIVKDGHNKIAYGLLLEELTDKNLKELEKNSSLLISREAYQVLSSKDRKTMNIVIAKDGENYTFRICNKELRRPPTSIRGLRISSSDIVNREDRILFEEMFSDDVPYYKILEITYGKKTIYKRNDDFIAIGKRVRANDCSDYEGLVGKIIGIKKGNEKDTNNAGTDIYVEFDVPTDKEIVKELEKRFSDLYREKLTLDDIALYEVIMSEDMLEFI